MKGTPMQPEFQQAFIHQWEKYFPFARMLDNMDERFLITQTWDDLRVRF
jgi:hypothetical protein